MTILTQTGNTHVWCLLLLYLFLEGQASLDTTAHCLGVSKESKEAYSSKLPTQNQGCDISLSPGCLDS